MTYDDEDCNHYDGYKIPKQFDRTEWLENAIKQYKQPYTPMYPRWWF